MTQHPQHAGTTPSRPSGEQGYLLLGLLFLFALILIGLAIAAPKIAMQIQREKEMETIQRGEQYKRAIQLYYRKFGAYPSTIAQLKETNQIRFLRQEYVDPMTGKKDWKLLHLGQVQMTAMGFFGKPAQTAGVTPAAGMPGANGMPANGGMPTAGGMPGGANANSSSNPNGASLDNTSDTDSPPDPTVSNPGANGNSEDTANPQSDQSSDDFGSISKTDVDATREDVLKRINATPKFTAEEKKRLSEKMETARSMERLLVIRFDTGQTALSRAATDDMVKRLKSKEVEDKLSDPTVVFVVAGYADAAGDPKKNLQISQQRADNVTKALKEKTNLLNVVHAVGMGSTDLLDGKRADQNRAVEIWAVAP